MSQPPPITLATPLSELRGVGPERTAQLSRLELCTVGDLLLHRPRRYEDRRQVHPIGNLKLNEAATARGRIVALGLKRFARVKSVFEIILEDGTGRLHCRWWNLPFMQNYFQQGDEVMVYGKPNSLRPRTIDHPETEVLVSNEESFIHLNRIVPVYPLTEGLAQRWLRSFIWLILAEAESAITEPRPGLSLADVPSRAKAIRMLHFPEELAETELARRRLALDEFIEMQLAIQTRRKNLLAKASGFPCGGDNHLIKPFLAQLPFRLTGAQTKVLRELRNDLRSGQPMRRLLQGDVGSGKTVAAACCALMTLESRFNVALMAPTEILAEQHYQTFEKWFEPLGINVHLQTGSYKTFSGQVAQAQTGATSLALPLLPDSSSVNQAAQTSTPACATAERRPESSTFVIGTHALIEQTFSLERLGLVIIDEQHKFGVAQREKLVRKGSYPHLLVMTATPIPRTLGLTLYGDLDISVIDQLPEGRKPIKTFVRTAETLPKVWAFLRQKLAEGCQVYVVYPRVEDSGTAGLKAVKSEWQNLRQELAPHEVGLLHGQLKAAQKEQVMADFRAGKTKVLLATPLVEVGLDVPNATVMLIENAEQFGLAQLHQLRGRIGRASQESYCILVASAKGADARQRLQILAETTDGFRIAEADLQLRGPGELLGQQQSGFPPLRFGNLAEDIDLIERARREAAQVLS